MHTLTTARRPSSPQVRSKFMTLEPNGNRYIRSPRRAPPSSPQVRSKFMTLEPNGNRYIRHFDSIRIIQAC